MVLSFSVHPPKSGQARAEITADAKVDGHDYLYGLDVIDYEHIEPQRLLPRASSTAVAVEVRNDARRTSATSWAPATKCRERSSRSAAK